MTSTDEAIKVCNTHGTLKNITDDYDIHSFKKFIKWFNLLGLHAILFMVDWEQKQYS